jgi:hypothetical protein
MPFMAVAQDSEGRLSGAVKDPDGAVVSGANVSLLHNNRAVVGSTITGAEGRFTLQNIAPGDYQLNVERSGFVRHRAAIHVTENNAQDLNIVLELTPIAEQVTITAEAGLVSDTRKVDTQVNVINERKIIERAPEVVAQVVDEEPGVNLQRTSPSLSAVFVRGLTGRNVAVYVDGVRYSALPREHSKLLPSRRMCSWLNDSWPNRLRLRGRNPDPDRREFGASAKSSAAAWRDCERRARCE